MIPTRKILVWLINCRQMKDFKQVDCFRKCLVMWKILGFYPLTTSQPLLYMLYSKIFVFFFIIMYSILFTLNLYFIPKSLESYIEDLIFYFSVLVVLSKVITFLVKKKEIKNAINILESDIFQPESERAAKIIDKTKNANVQYWKIYTAVTITSTAANVVSPLLSHFVFKADLLLPICSYSFLPHHLRHSLLYPLYFYQSIGMFLHVLCTINIDSFFIGSMRLLIAQLKILESKFTDITENFKAETNVPLNEENLILKLNNVFVHYNEVTKFCDLIQDIFSIAVFVQFSMGSYIICLCLIRFTMPATWQYLYFLSTYTLVMVMQILIPSYFGTRIMDKSCFLSHAIYSCDWTPRCKSFKSSMRLFVERANRPLSITGWKMFPLSLVTFTSIMNTAYSFYTLLRHMQSR